MIESCIKRNLYFLQISDGKHSLTLCHYPMMSLKHQMRSYMIYGHIHANTDMDFWLCIKARDNLLNASVDINGFTPVTFDELQENNCNFKETHWWVPWNICSKGRTFLMSARATEKCGLPCGLTVIFVSVTYFIEIKNPARSPVIRSRAAIPV